MGVQLPSIWLQLIEQLRHKDKLGRVAHAFNLNTERQISLSEIVLVWAAQ